LVAAKLNEVAVEYAHVSPTTLKTVKEMQASVAHYRSSRKKKNNTPAIAKPDSWNGFMIMG
jgi:hypothetical protein